MKKVSLVILSLVVAGLTAYAGSNEVYSVNSVGYGSVTIPTNSFVMVSVQFDGFDPTLKGVLGAQLRGNGIPAESDQVQLWDPGITNYNSYMQFGGEYYGPLPSFTLASDTPLLSGMAMWIKSPATGPYKSDTNEVTIAGEVVDVATQTVDIVSSFQQAGYPFSSVSKLGDLTLADDGTGTGTPATSDALWVWDPAITNYNKYMPFGGSFYGPLPSFTLADDVELPITQGFWYEAISGFTWTETNKYLNNL
jgi:hypothetical protein